MDVCQHGMRRQSCDACAFEAELAIERAAREKAEAMLREMVKELNEERHRVFAVEGESAEDDWADWCIRVDELIDRYRAEFGEDK